MLSGLNTKKPRVSSILLLIVVPILATISSAQAPQPDTAAIHRRVDAIIHRMTLEQKLKYIGGTGFAIRGVPDLGIPAFEMSDGPYGVRSNAGLPSTTYAAGISLAASWNRDLALRVGESIGRDARARGVHFMLGPGVDIYRSPRNGRNFEYFGEDPFFAGAMAVAYIDGIQSQGVSATIKHFIANNSEFLRHDSDSTIDERSLREIYLPGFEAAVKQGHVGAIMDAYNLVNGLHMTQNGHFNIDILRKEWGFTGIDMSDWDATYDAIGAANGGLDIEMPTGKFMNSSNLLPAIQNGSVKEATIDAKIFHILDTAGRFGWLDRPQTENSIPLMNERNNAIALQSAEEGLVLLKNKDDLLPLNKAAIKSILVVGPDAYPGNPVGGGSAAVKPFHTVSDLEGLSAYLGKDITVYYDRGLPTLAEVAHATKFVTQIQNGAPGLKLESFLNTELSGTPVTTGIVPHIDEPDATSSDPKYEFSRRWTGYYIAPRSGDYIVVLQGSGRKRSGNRVYLDGKLIIDNWILDRAIQPHVTLSLSSGPHKVIVEDMRHNPMGGEICFGIIPQDEIVSAKAKILAAKADVVVIAAGFDEKSEREGSDRTFDLPFGQDQLIRSLSAINKKSIVTVTSGGNVDSESWIDHVPVYMENWYPGQAGGTALAEILFGAVNPSGHLPVSFERRAQDNPTFNNYYPQPDSVRIVYKEGIFVGYRGYQQEHIAPLFPFGFGLSYTTFKFSNLSIKPAGATATISFDITNTGLRTGKEVAQVYVSETHSTVLRPQEELKGFDKVELAPGVTEHVVIHLNDRAFAYWDAIKGSWRIDPGIFVIGVGDSSVSISLKGNLEIPKAAAIAAIF